MWTVHLWARSLCRHLVAFEMPWAIWNIRGRLADMIKGSRQDLCPSARAAGGQAGHSGHLKWQLTTMCGQGNQVLSLHSCLSQSPLWVGKYLVTVNTPCHLGRGSTNMSCQLFSEQEVNGCDARHQGVWAANLNHGNVLWSFRMHLLPRLKIRNFFFSCPKARVFGFTL